MLEISLHILDIVENSLRAGAGKVWITLREDPDADLLTLTIEDNGSGMEKEMLGKITDPFFTTKKVRKIGLGIPLLAQAVEATGGTLSLESQPGAGTKVRGSFKLSHLDRQPLGDIAGTLVTLIAGNPTRDFIYRHQRRDREFVLDTRQIREEIGTLAINNSEVINFLRNYVQQGLQELGAEA